MDATAALRMTVRPEDATAGLLMTVILSAAPMPSRREGSGRGRHQILRARRRNRALRMTVAAFRTVARPSSVPIAHASLSKIPAAPMPPPTHMVTSP
jgi:hypothetical protein